MANVRFIIIPDLMKQRIVGIIKKSAGAVLVEVHIFTGFVVRTVSGILDGDLVFVTRTLTGRRTPTLWWVLICVTRVCVGR